MIKQIISCIPEVLLQMGKNSNEKILLCINLFMILYALFTVKLVQKYENKKMGRNFIIKYNHNLFCLHVCRNVCRIVFLLSSFS